MSGVRPTVGGPERRASTSGVRAPAVVAAQVPRLRCEGGHRAGAEQASGTGSSSTPTYSTYPGDDAINL